MSDGRVGPFALLRRRRDLRNLTAGLALSYVGSGAGLTALVLYVQSTEGTGVAVGALLLAETVPRLLGPLAGAVVDRSDLRRLMVGCDLAQAVLFGILVLLPPFAAILAIAAIANLLLAAYSPARGTLIADIVEPGELATAYAVENTTFNLQVAVGPVIGGVLVAAGGVRLALGVDAATFLASAVFLSRLRPTPRKRPEAGAGIIDDARAGLAYALRHPVARALVLTLLATVAFLGVDNVALPFLVRDTLDAGPAAYGVAAGAFGIGMLAGSIGLAFRPGRSPAAVYLSGILAGGLGSIATGLSPIVGAVVALQGVAGLGNGLENVANNTLVSRHVSPEMLGRVFGLVATAAYAGAGVASLIGGFFLDLTSPRTVFITGGIGALATFALALRPLLRAENRIAAEAEGG